MRVQSSFSLIFSISLIGIWRIPASTADDCSSEILNFCLNSFTKPNIEIYHLDDDVPSWNDSSEKLKIRCQAYDDFSTCMELVAPFCNKSMQLALQGLGNAYHFLCNDDCTTDYSTNQSCYVSPDVRGMTTNCNRTFKIKLSQLSYIDNSIPLYCSSVDDYIDCLTSGITTLCSAKAAKWQSDWIRNLRQPEMQANKCPGWVAEDDSNNVWATAVLVALAMVTTIMVVGIIILIIFIVRKRMYRERLRRALNGPDGDSTPLPPPYSVVVETPGPDGLMQPHLVDSLSPSSHEDGSTRNVQGTPSVPFKVPILPPPYSERPEAGAPPYYTSAFEAPEQVNGGFSEEEGVEKTAETPPVVKFETEGKVESSNA